MPISGSWKLSYLPKVCGNAADQKLKFIRGVTTYPLPRQSVHLLTREETSQIYSAAEGHQGDGEYTPLVSFAYYVGADNAVCRANVDKMLGMHCAVLGSTGSGKSGAVAALLHSMLETYPRTWRCQSSANSHN